MQSDAKVSRAKATASYADSHDREPLGGPDRAKLARLPAPVHSVREKGRQLFANAFRDLFDNADDALFALADQAVNNQEQNLYFESMREVRIRRRELESRFDLALDDAFMNLLSQNRRVPATGVETRAAEESIPVLSGGDLEELVALDSMINRTEIKCGPVLKNLALRLDSLVPSSMWYTDNPLGPESVCTAFASAAGDLNADIKAKLVLFRLFDRYVLGELPRIYETLNGVLGEPEGSSNSHDRSATPRMAGGNDLSPSPEPEAAGESAGVPSHPDSPAAATNSASGDDLVAALTRIQRQLACQWSNPGTDTQKGDLDQVVQEALAKQKGTELSPTQAETVNFVKLLFRFILDDGNLADPLKALIGCLDVPILKVALLDDTFFARSGHPARRLLNDVATASLGWQAGPDLERDPLHSKVKGMVFRILNDFEADLSLFYDVLADFSSFLEQERRRASVNEQRTVDAEDGRARTETTREQVNRLLDVMLEGKSIPEDVQEILHKAWSNVLFLIALNQGTDSPDWQQARGTAEDLIWSVTVDPGGASRQQLLDMIPGLVKRLREGLEQISFDPAEMTQLLNRLEKLHMTRLQSGPDFSGSESAAATETPPESDGGGELAAPGGATPVASDGASGEGESATAPAVDSSYLALIDKLTQGTWFRMTDDQGNRYGCRLAAIVKPTGKYIFVNRSGMKVAEKTREGLALALKEDKLQLLDDTALFDRALESVVGSLRKSR